MSENDEGHRRWSGQGRGVTNESCGGFLIYVQRRVGGCILVLNCVGSPQYQGI